MHDIKTLIGKLNFMGSQHALSQTARRAMLTTVAMFRAGPAKIAQDLSGIAAVEAFLDAEMDTWLEPEDIASGKPGPFDACDLRAWLLIAEKAGVPFVPARQILSLTEDELSSIDQVVHMPEHVARAMNREMMKIAKSSEAGTSDTESFVIPKIVADIATSGRNAPLREKVSEALFNAMDDVPANWIVRSHIAGPSTLKALAGAGVIETADDAWSPDDPNLEIGAGWVRHGNRRRIDATDARFIDTFPGHKPVMHYLARPWVTPARRLDGPDPHRHGTPFAGKGSWPSEWRVFVQDGEVTGVACYYGWAGEATPLNAKRALQAAEAARKIIATAKAMGLSSRFADLEIHRWRMNEAVAKGQSVPQAFKEEIDLWPRDGLNCSLDFIEVAGEDGECVMTLLEGGPGHGPVGGGHPCAFAGHGMTKETGSICRCEGVALKLMDHVMLGDPKTWKPGETRDRILSWDETRALAHSQQHGA